MMTMSTAKIVGVIKKPILNSENNKEKSRKKEN